MGFDFIDAINYIITFVFGFLIGHQHYIGK